MKLYLTLYHGRRSPEEDLEDWGLQGPTFGPLEYVHTTYAYHIKLGIPNYKGAPSLYVIEDLLYYDGIYYGDWSVFTADEKVKTTPYSERKAERITK